MQNEESTTAKTWDKAELQMEHVTSGDSEAGISVDQNSDTQSQLVTTDRGHRGFKRSSAQPTAREDQPADCSQEDDAEASHGDESASEEETESENSGDEEEVTTNSEDVTDHSAGEERPRGPGEGSGVVDMASIEGEEEEESETGTDSADDESEDEADEDSEEEDEEPKLKYQRLAATLSETLKKDAVSAMAVSDRFLALGTHWGMVHILDLIGTDVKRFQSHSATVNDISIDTNGEFIASAADDGKVVINSLYTPDNQTFNYKRPVKAVSLEPDYSRKTARQFVSGGMAEYLLLSGKGWFGNKDVVIHSGEGPIYAVKWRGNFIAWANEAGVKIYDVASQQRFAYIDRPPGSPRADLFRCNLCWKSDTELFIGWANHVKIGQIKERSKMDVASGLPTRYVDIICQFATDFIVSGIAPLDDYIVLLSYMTDIAEVTNVDVVHDGPRQRKKARAPEIHILDIHGDPVANDVLSLFGFEHYQANDYRLEYLPAENPAENSFYIVSPKDIVVAKPRDLEDHIEWLVERKKYHEALKAAEGAGPSYAGRLQVNSIVEIGQKYMGTLMESGQYEEAAKTCPKVLRADSQLWEHWIYAFAEAKQLPVIRPYIPLGEPKLSSTVYELVLVHYLNADLETFLEILKAWPPALYSISHVIDAVELALKSNPGNRLLMESAVELYKNAKRWDMVLFFGLQLRLPDILPMVKRYNLYSFVQDNVLLVMEYDQHLIDTDRTIAEEIARAVAHDDERTELGDLKGSVTLGRIRAAGRCPGVQTLVTSTDRVPVARVVEQLEQYPKFLHVFLDAVFRKDPHEATEYHPLQVELYAEFDYPRMLEFLRSSTYYSVQKSYSICETRDLVPEMVFLLGKMGDNRRALMLIIERLGDVARAIEFAKDQNDEELWEDLLKYSMDKPPFIVGLLENLGSHINPIRLVQRIPNGLEIPGLRNALIKIMSDYGIQMSLREGCEKILVSDSLELLASLFRARKRGLALSGVTCSLCESPVTTYDPTGDASLVIFFCRHSYHSECLDAAADAKAKGTVTASASPLAARAAEAMSATVDRAVRLVYAQPKLDGGSALDPNASVPESVPPPVEIKERLPAKPPVVKVCPICRSAAQTQKRRGGERKAARSGKDLVMKRAGTSMF